MRNDLKNRVPLGSAIDKNLSNKLTNLSKETKIPKSKLLDEAIELLLEYRKTNSERDNI